MSITILSVHNSYQQPGGEDEVYRQEAMLLERYGHKVIRHHAHNDSISHLSQIELFAKTIFNSEAYKQTRALLRQHKPSVVHVHNTFPLLSPAIYYAAAHEGVPVVQTLHNYRWLCPAGVFYRQGQICENCLQSGSFWPAVQHKCYRHNRAASAAAAAMLTIHRLAKTFDRHIATYIVLSHFALNKFVEGGLAPGKITIKPNFVFPDPAACSAPDPEPYCLYVGRLTPEKGLRTLLDAWTRYTPPMKLLVAGDGDVAGEVAEAARVCDRIHWLGRIDRAEVFSRMARATAVVVPSLWYEPFGMVVIEALALGVPVVASRIGGLEEMIDHGRTGLHFEAGAASQLADQVRYLAENPAASLKMREEARAEFERRYTGERNYELLIGIYQRTISRFGSKSSQMDEKFSQEDEPETLVQIAG